MTPERRHHEPIATKPIAIIDVFAGPGGLGEGFSSIRRPDGSRAFKLAMSVEKDPIAHRTLALRAAYRMFDAEEVPQACPRRFKTDPPCRLNIDPGLDGVGMTTSVDKSTA
jgi:site-specific DNA-cytosine methylase